MNHQDVLFLQGLMRISETNRLQPTSMQSLRVVKSSLSDELLKLFEVDKDALGKWMFNVYVEFTPLYTTHPAKDWMKLKG